MIWHVICLYRLIDYNTIIKLNSNLWKLLSNIIINITQTSQTQSDVCIC